jgi:hypothetical protein
VLVTVYQSASPHILKASRLIETLTDVTTRNNIRSKLCGLYKFGQTVSFSLLKHVIEGKLEEQTEMTGRRGSRRKQLQDDLKEKRRYWKLKEEALDRTLWRTRFGRGYGPVVRQTAE